SGVSLGYNAGEHSLFAITSIVTPAIRAKQPIGPAVSSLRRQHARRMGGGGSGMSGIIGGAGSARFSSSALQEARDRLFGPIAGIHTHTHAAPGERSGELLGSRFNSGVARAGMAGSVSAAQAGGISTSFVASPLSSDEVEQDSDTQREEDQQ